MAIGAVLLAGVPAAGFSGQTLILAAPNNSQVTLRVGSVNTIDTVSFAVPLTNVGDSTPIAGTPSGIVVQASAKAPGKPGTSQLRLQADSSVPMTNGATTLSFTGIRWQSATGDIPSGRFNGSAAQLLATFLDNQQLSDSHDFFYDNDRILDPGTYTGRITYTLVLP